MRQTIFSRYRRNAFSFLNQIINFYLGFINLKEPLFNVTLPLFGAESQFQVVKCRAEDVAGPINNRQFSRLLRSSSSAGTESSSPAASLVAWVYSNLVAIHRHFFTAQNCGYRATFARSAQPQSAVKDVRR